MKTLAVFKNKSFTKLFIASFTSQMGSVIGMTAFMFYLLHRFSNQPIYATINEMMYSLPTLFLFFIVGVVADRLDRQRITVNSDWIRAVLSLCLIGALWIGSIPLIFILLFLRQSVSKFFVPAEQAIIQGVLTKEQYPVAAGLNQMTASIFALFGNGLGILAYWTLGIRGAILIDTISFVISALLIYSCKLTSDTRLPNGHHKLADLNIKLVLADFKDGMHYIVSNKLLLSLVIGFAVFGIVNGGFSVMPVYILKYKLSPNHYEQMSIWMGIIFGSGLLIGSIIATLVSSKIKEYHMMIVGIFLSGLVTALSAVTTHLSFFFIMIFLLAIILPFINIAIGGWLPRIVSPKMMGRVQGWIDPLMMFSQTLTLGVISITFPVFLSINAIFWIVGGSLIIVALYYFIILPKQALKYDLGGRLDPSTPDIKATT